MSDRMVLVGRRYESMANTWQEWDKPFDEVVQAIAERAKDRKASGHPDEIIEVVLVRRAFVRAEVSIDEPAGGGES